MIRNLRWSSLLLVAATACVTLTTTQVAQAQSGSRLTGSGPDGPYEYNPRSDSDRRPGLINPLCGLVGGPAVSAGDCDSQTGLEWEGIASTDYLTIEASVYSPPNPDIAVGPDDILAVVNRVISRWANPNAPRFDNSGGTGAVPYSPANSYYYAPSSRNFLDVWLGEAALNELCPTFPRSNLSCVIDNASVRYDQMQGRFVVLFTVIDTGLVNCNGCSGTPTPVTNPLRRKASWVLIVSRWATGCQGTGGGFASACVPNTTPAVPGLTGNTEFFTTPNPPGPTQTNPNSGGINGNWISYYGIPDNTCDSSCLYGNINSISDLRRGGSFAGARTIDCNNTAVGDSTRVCYLPSSARLGLDNDNIIISSSVYNDNVPLASRGIPAQTNSLVLPFEGTRLRVHKKAAFYQGVSSLNAPCSTPMCPGASQLNPQLQGDFYDLFTVATPYTFDRSIVQVVPGGNERTVVGPHYEPEHVRGRSLASFNGNGNVDNAFSSIWGAVDQGYTASGPPLNSPPQNLLYHRAITYTRVVAGLLGANVQLIPAVVDLPKLQGGIPTLGQLRWHIVPAFTNPNDILQRAKLVQPGTNAQLPTPYLYVGDDRPHRVISREGHRYIARVAGLEGYRFDPVNNNQSTVVYDIVQKLLPADNALEVYNTSWGNGRYYAPMHDTPANVVQYGSISPINLLPYLEKLFVGTTFPALAPSDPRTFSYGNLPNVALNACKGQEPSVGTSNASYPSLFDMRCGEDAYDAAQAYRHPLTGAFTPADFQVTPQPTGFPEQIVPMGIRGGASTDVNNLGLWLYGAYAKGRQASILGFGQWGTYIAHYPLTFPIRDPYNNLNQTYTDVQPGHPFFTFVQTAKQTEIDPGSRTATVFNVGANVTRAEMAKWTVRAQMDECGITNYLNSTGGFFCSFADVECPATPGGGVVADGTGTTQWRYIETMYRRGYTKGCSDSNDGQRRFCPSRTLSRGEMAVFIIRAKMNSVFPTVTSGAFTTVTCQPGGTTIPLAQTGDLFGLFVGCSPYFSDVPNTHIYFSFIQKLRELRISNGTTLSTATTLGTYTPEANITRGELMVFLVRGFFP